MKIRLTRVLVLAIVLFALNNANTCGYGQGTPIVPYQTKYWRDVLKTNHQQVGTVVQVVNVQSGEVGSFNTQIPFDDTIPQNTEGTEVLTLTITPTSATNMLKIEVVNVLSVATANSLMIALFQDATANALASAAHTIPTAYLSTISFVHYMTAGTTSSTTFKVRVGGNAGATITWNGQAAARKMGGTLASSITITEIQAAEVEENIIFNAENLIFNGEQVTY